MEQNRGEEEKFLCWDGVELGSGEIFGLLGMVWHDIACEWGIFFCCTVGAFAVWIGR